MCFRALIVLIFFLQLSNAVHSQRVIQLLHENWQFAQVDTEDYLPATVPGNVISDLYHNGVISNPLIGVNERKVQYITEQNWIYQLTFIPTNEILIKKQIFLCFEGLDTYADVFLNDICIAQSRNMFLPLKLDIKENLKNGKNQLKIVFYSPVVQSNTLWENYAVRLPDRASVMIRKAAYHFGWDWAPRLPTSGIWRPVYLEGSDEVTIDHLQIITREIIGDTAYMECIVTLHSTESVFVDLLLSTPIPNYLDDRPSILLEPGHTAIRVPYIVPHAKLWWPNGMGEPFLYEMNCSVYSPGGQMYDYEITDYGIRTIELVEENDSFGNSFYFSVNGTPLFIKGANYIPAEYFAEQTTNEKYEKLIIQAANDNMNMLRVWGGGIYEDDVFYNLCDRYGLLVWQDFMFACAMYPYDSAFVESVKNEVQSNIIRLRNHPSIALWCGNNEISEGWFNWGWQNQFKLTPEDSASIYRGYLNLFEVVIPEIVETFDGSRFYWASSPSTGWGREEAYNHGDVHYWGVWWGMRPFESFNSYTGRFVSEYGFQGLPAMQTLIDMGVDPSNGLNDSVLASHQKHPKGFETIESYMKLYSHVPKNIEEYVHMSQFIQCQGMTTAIEAHRRAMPRCMGSLYWQFNDCWPVVSWSGIDYYGRRKAMQFHLKELFNPLMISIIENDSILQIWGISDIEVFDFAILQITAMDFSGNIFYEEMKRVKIDAGFSEVIAEIDGNVFDKRRSECLIRASISGQNGELASKIFYPTDLKNQELQDCEILTKCVVTDQDITITITAPCVCRFVELSYNGNTDLFEENYFDIVPREKKEVHVVNIRAEEFDCQKLKIRKLQ